MQMYGVLFSSNSHVSRAIIPWFLKRHIELICVLLSDQRSPAFLGVFCLVFFLESMSSTVRQLVSAEIVREVNLQQEMLE